METFRIGFEGPGVDNGEIDVLDLAPALLALGELVQTANSVLNQDRAKARLIVRASENGSFIAVLALDVSFITDLLDKLAAHGQGITAAKDLTNILLAAGGGVGAVGAGVFAALRALRGRKIEKIVDNSDGTKTLIGGGNSVIVEKRTLILLQSPGVREMTEMFARSALRAKGVEGIRIMREKDTGAPDVRLEHTDIPALSMPSQDEAEVIETTHEREGLLKIVTGQFQEGYKWRFSDGSNTFTADMKGTDFLTRMENAEIRLSKHDTLKCRIRETQTLQGSNLRTDIEITAVTKYIPGPRQLTFPV